MSNTFKVKESLVDTMEKDSQLDNLKDSKVTDVSTLCQKQVDLEAEINRDKRKLEEKEESLRKLSLEIIPNALAEMNLKSLKLADGSEVSIKDFLWVFAYSQVFLWVVEVIIHLLPLLKW